MDILFHPNIALLLMTLGTYGVIYEFANPGALFPGVVGGIMLLLGLYAMHILPIDYSGLALLFLGLALMTAEAFTLTFGILGLGGAVAFVCGAALLTRNNADAATIDLWLILTLAALSFAVLSVTLGMIVKSLRQPQRTGREELLNTTGEVLTWTNGQGDIRITGEIWQARSTNAHIIAPGQSVRVTALDGLVLIVEPVA